MVRRTETDPIDRDEQLGEAVEAYLALAEEGSPPDPEAFAARYPDLGEDLQAALEGLALIRGLVGEPSGPGNRLESGRRIAGYRIVRELGRGGMGTVYEAVHVGLDRPVALKVLGTHATPDSTGRRRFLNEARTAAGLHHTHIVPVFDVGQVGGLCYYAMQRIEGSGLDQVLRHLRRDRSIAAGSSTGGTTPASRTRLATAGGTPGLALQGQGTENDTVTWMGQTGGDLSGAGRALGRDRDDEPPPYDPPVGSAYYRWVAEVGREAAEALSHAHRRGIIHRDVKPSNLLVDARGIVWVADFGLARRLADPGLTHHDSLLGTPRYMSPEQARTGPIDGRTDVYSLGATLYELLTLRPPFEGQTAAELVEQIRDRAPASPRQFDRRIPRDLETIVLKALAKRPADRYASALDLAEDLERFLNLEPVRARRISPLGRAWRYARRHPGGTTIATVAAATVLAVVTTAYVRIVHDRDQARDARRRAEIANSKTLSAMREEQAANRKLQVEMRERYLSEATVVRHSNLPNRRATGLGLLSRAAALEPDPELKVKLRNEAVEFLVLRDVEARPEFATGATRGIAFGPEGVRLAALSANGEEFSLWNVANRTRLERHRFNTPMAEPTSPPAAATTTTTTTNTTTGRPAGPPRFRGGHSAGLAVAGDCVIVILPEGKGLRLFDLTTGTPIRDWATDGRRVLSLFAAPGGHRLVTTELATTDDNGIRDNSSRGDMPRMEFQIRLYDLNAIGQPIATLARWKASFPPRDDSLIAIAPDGETIATARSRETTVSLWSAEDGLALGEPFEAQAELTALALGPDGLLSVAGGGQIRFWEIASRTPLPPLTPFQSYIRQLRFNPNGTLLAAAGAQGSGVEIWDPASHTALAVLTVPNQVEDLAFSADGRTLAAASSTASTSVWAIVDPVVRSQISGFDTLPTSLAFGADQRLAMGTAKGTIRVWNPGHCPSTTQQVIAEPPPGAAANYVQGDRATTLVFNEQDHLIAIEPDAIPTRHRGSRRGQPRMFPSPVASIARGQTHFVASGHQIMVWNGPTEPQRWSSLEIPRSKPAGSAANSERSRWEPDPWRQLAASPTGDRLYLLDNDSNFHAVALDGGRARNLPWQLPGDANRLSLSPDGQTLAIGDKAGNVLLVDTARGTVRTRLLLPSSESEGQPVWSLAFSPDGRELAVGLQQGHIDLWSLDNPTAPLLRLIGHRGLVSILAYDPQGRFLASAGSDKLVDIWDLSRVRTEFTRIGLNW
ncbi:WD domain-containing protein, G-beta repeat-containing protein [Singulisphaera sp. GP187]|uniref:WD40 repeat domain-containing serine/threonine protein kinase n=1 Tax=Singulisphaera sp. GP187 TaxID=1882752 RepID=UPI00092AB7D3|nr:WD40 repeat domain-containing serine/threonine-protein kinase [Singulisphaera sp. GP187]SIO29425.1 WD domain-containing protein, G-beta repeat-containing protein [Singulisphaera sp. GP187]